MNTEDVTEKEFQVPIALVEAVDKIHRTVNALQQELQRPPSCEEIASSSRIEAGVVHLVMALTHYLPFPEEVSPEEKLLRASFDNQEAETRLAEKMKKVIAQEAKSHGADVMRKVLATLTIQRAWSARD
jgi:DNA-directed RNA polymerase specialized sigma subunit